MTELWKEKQEMEDTFFWLSFIAHVQECETR